MPIMKITEALITEHRVFSVVFDYIDRILPKLNTPEEAKVLAGLVEALLCGHGDTEENLAYVTLDRAGRQRPS